MNNKPRICQVMDYFGKTYYSDTRDHKIPCPCHDDQNPSSKIFPRNDNVHCFVYNRTFYPEGLYAWLKHIPYRVAIEECDKLFPKPLRDSLFINSAMTPEELQQALTRPAPMSFDALVTLYAKLLIRAPALPELQRHEAAFQAIRQLARTDVFKATQALLDLQRITTDISTLARARAT